MSNPSTYGLKAAPVVRWLLSVEPDVHEAVITFLRDGGDPSARVVGPPPINTVLAIRNRDRDAPLPRIELPMVTLNFRRCEHEGQPGVEVSCSAIDLDEIDSWHRLSRMMAAKRALDAKQAPILQPGRA